MRKDKNKIVYSFVALYPAYVKEYKIGTVKWKIQKFIVLKFQKTIKYFLK